MRCPVCTTKIPASSPACPECGFNCSEMDGFKTESERVSGIQKERRAKDQDIAIQYEEEFNQGPLNPERRASCELDPFLFATTYLTEDFFLPFAPKHYREGEKLKQAIQKKTKFANADKRGGGKTTRMRAFTLWGILYGHISYIVYVTATSKLRKQTHEYVKKQLLYNDLLIEDFPEATLPFKHCGAMAQKANHQLYKGESSLIACSSEQFVFPNLDLPYMQCSQSVMDFCSMGGGLRGRNHKVVGGGTVRPDLVVCDDPQSRKTAKSKPMTDDLERIITGDIAYMNGLKGRVGILVPCTVVYKNDLADRLLDNELNPNFQGERSKCLTTMPTNMKWWREEYDMKRVELLMLGMKDEEISAVLNDMYVKNRKHADEGAEASWEHDFQDNEISAIQHGMNRFLENEEAFQAEYQNEPMADTGAVDLRLDEREVMGRFSGTDRYELPDDTEYLTSHWDMQDDSIWWVVMAFKADFTGTVVDYGCWPEQDRNHYTKYNLEVTLKEKYGCAKEAAWLHGLGDMANTILARDYVTQSGEVMNIQRCLVDANDHDHRDVVKSFCRVSEHSNILMPSFGRPVTLAKPYIWDPSSKPKRDKGEIRGAHWRTQLDEKRLRYLQIDVSFWKAFIFERFMTDVKQSGAYTVWGHESGEYKTRIITHRLLGEHLSCESMHTHSDEKGTSIKAFQATPGRDNEWLDNIVGCTVAANMQGCSRAGVDARRQAAPRKKANQKSWKQIHDEKRGR